MTHRGLTDLTAVDSAVFGAYITQCKAECSHSISRNFGEKNESWIVFVEGIDITATWKRESSGWSIVVSTERIVIKGPILCKILVTSVSNRNMCL